MRIGEVATRTGVSASTLRFYEREGLLPPPERIGGKRRYDESIVARLRAIAVAQHAGFTIAEIRVLLTGFAPGTTPSERWHALASRKLPEVEALLLQAAEMKRLLEEGLACGCAALDDCELLGSAGAARA